MKNRALSCKVICMMRNSPPPSLFLFSRRGQEPDFSEISWLTCPPVDASLTFCYSAVLEKSGFVGHSASTFPARTLSSLLVRLLVERSTERSMGQEHLFSCGDDTRPPGTVR